ncbi:hypothetical protein [Paenibacillus senegalimassiliensis]|uniref:hypothetical protein n=1 Tax=Paenibacillus senegalimassiliensis TaxID=1737426 RepID=UPI00073E1BE5|nr:hypothetical protein [Paenibacillus senegalimassiliensis]
MTERIPCQTEGCKATILPATAAKTGGICMPCHQEKERQAYQEYIEQNRRDVNLFADMTDPVEILQTMYEPKEHDPLIRYIPYSKTAEQIYLSLQENELSRMVRYGVERLDSEDEDTGIDILLSLVCYRGVRLEDEVLELVSRLEYFPGVLFKGASSRIRDHLLEGIAHDQDRRQALLLALVWIDDEAVVEQFREWRLHPPTWTEELHIPPEEFALEAGWELTNEGERRWLFLEDSYPIVRAEPEGAEETRHSTSEEELLTHSKHTCPWCHGPLTTLMKISAHHPAMQHLSYSGETITIATCVDCSCYGVVYMELDEQGNAQWSSYNQRPDYLPDRQPGESRSEDGFPAFRLATTPRHGWHAASWMLEPAASQLGGHPTWIQDTEYPLCPCCHKRMINLGQIDWAEVEYYGEGNYYMFLCPQDRITATNFQQT